MEMARRTYSGDKMSLNKTTSSESERLCVAFFVFWSRPAHEPTKRKMMRMTPRRDISRARLAEDGDEVEGVRPGMIIVPLGSELVIFHNGFGRRLHP